MSGHSKWANIKHRKGKADAARGAATTKISREITTAVRIGGADPTGNMRLKLALQKARENNIPKDNIQRAIQKGQGTLEGQSYEEITYEGYGLGGVAVIVETMTDNLNRTVGEVRHAFSKNGGNLGTSGSVAYMFSKRGEITFDDVSLEDTIMEVALEAGATDIENNGDSITVVTEPENFGDVMDALEKAGLKSDNAEVTMSPSTMADVTDVEDAKKIMKMIDMLEDLDDVQEVYTNVNFTDDVMEQLDD